MQEQATEDTFRKAKTHKGRKILSARESKPEEGPRKTLFLKSTKTSEITSKFERDLVKMLFLFNLLIFLQVFPKKTQFIDIE